MCGKENPADALTCHFCHIPINPLSSPGETNPPEEISGWLDDLRSGQQPFTGAEENSEENISAGAEEVPEWLARIRQRNQEEHQAGNESSAPAAGESGQEALPDWMSDLGGLQDSPPPTGEEDWLSRLRSSSAAPGTENQPAEAQPTPALPDTEDWLQQLQGFHAAAPEPEEMQPAGLEQPVEKPAMETPAGNGVSLTEGDGDFAGWLRSLEEQQIPTEETGSTLSQIAGMPPHEETLDEKLSHFESESGAPTGHIPDWLTIDSNVSPPKAEPESGSEISNWLAGLEQQSSLPQEETTPPAAGETPDWLKAFEQETLPQEETTPPANGETPEWLKAFEQETLPQEETTPPAAGETPDWLKEFKQPDNAVAAEETKNSSYKTDWFSQLSAEPVATGEENRAVESPEEPAIAPEAGETETTQTGSITSPIPYEEIIPTLDSPAFTLETGDLQPPGESSPPFVGLAAADWPPEEEPAGMQAEPVPEGLAPANLPGWLQAMRPIEAVMGEQVLPVDEDQIEKTGPLAGLPGVLPSENLVTQYRKPPVYSSRLLVSERQRAHSDILENLVGEASKPQAVQKENLDVPRTIVRLVLGLILMFAILFPILIAAPTNETPGLVTTLDSLMFSNQVESLQPGQTVLLAIDYEPGYSGEMRFAASGVIQRLLQKQVNLALISTIPAGPVLAEDLLARSAEKLQKIDTLPENALSEQVINLGYLPGGISSLLELATSPRQAAVSTFSVSAEARSPWDHPALSGVNSLQDFAAVLVITDSIDTGRAWIEQTVPSLGDSPLLMVASAQASPLLQPYVETGQVKALLSGLVGGMAYERLAGVAGSPAAYWNAYRYALYVGVAFILSGVILRAMVALLSRRKAFK